MKTLKKFLLYTAIGLVCVAISKLIADTYFSGWVAGIFFSLLCTIAKESLLTQKHCINGEDLEKIINAKRKTNPPQE